MEANSIARPAPRPPTLRDVAARAKVSMMTVSNVINARTARVSEETRSRIVAAIDELGYRPQRSARGLRMQREYAIGLTIIHPDRRFLDDPYITEVAAGMSNALAIAGFGLTINGVPDLDGLRKTLVRVLNVDALAVMASGSHNLREKIYRLLDRQYHPLAIIQDEAPPDLSDACSFIQDDAAGAAMVTDALIVAGATRLLFAAPRYTWPAVERREAGLLATAQRRAKVNRVACDESDFEQSIATIVAYMTRRGVPDAIVAANDQIGIAAIRAATQLGIRVPEDLMVTGFNAFRFRQFSVPLITSVASPAYAIGEEVARELLKRLENGFFRSKFYVLPVAMTEGASIRLRGTASAAQRQPD
jgi:DNA-binding LacI/PurR family transcriptional regulator